MIKDLKKLKQISDYQMLALSKEINVFKSEISKNIKQEQSINQDLNKSIDLDIKDSNVLRTLSMHNHTISNLRSSLQALNASNEFLNSKIKEVQEKINKVIQTKEKYNYLIDKQKEKLKKLELKKQNKMLEEFVYSKFSKHRAS